MNNFALLICESFLAPPDISVEKTWIHAADGCEVELVCTLLGDLSSDVSTCVLNI